MSDCYKAGRPGEIEFLPSTVLQQEDNCQRRSATIDKLVAWIPRAIRHETHLRQPWEKMLAGNPDCQGRESTQAEGPALEKQKTCRLNWARRKGYCKRGSGGQRKIEKIRATFWDSKLL